jgi:hypothetical protein
MARDAYKHVAVETDICCFLSLQAAWDLDNDGKISWDEALSGYSRIIYDMDFTNESNHWVRVAS